MSEVLAITTSARTRHRKHRREVLADNPKPRRSDTKSCS
jgi:hypothetical protein